MQKIVIKYMSQNALAFAIKALFRGTDLAGFPTNTPPLSSNFVSLAQIAVNIITPYRIKDGWLMQELNLEVYRWLAQHMSLMFAVVFFMLGSCVGSFLNVVICRLPFGLSLLRPPSSCPVCSSRIPIHHNIPILSYILLGGRCASCKLRISPRYPLIELLSGLLWAFTAYSYAETNLPILTAAFLLTAQLCFVASLFSAAVIDYDHLQLPNEITLGGTVVALLYSGFLPELQIQTNIKWFPDSPHLNSASASLIGMFFGAGVMFIIYLIGVKYLQYFAPNLQNTNSVAKDSTADDVVANVEATNASQPDANNPTALETKPTKKAIAIESAIGFGDVKLLAFIGAFLGAANAIMTIIIGAVIGVLYGVPKRIITGKSSPGSSVFTKLKQRWQTGDSFIPFGPALAIGAFLCMFFHNELVKILL